MRKYYVGAACDLVSYTCQQKLSLRGFALATTTQVTYNTTLTLHYNTRSTGSVGIV